MWKVFVVVNMNVKSLTKWYTEICMNFLSFSSFLPSFLLFSFFFGKVRFACFLNEKQAAKHHSKLRSSHGLRAIAIRSSFWFPWRQNVPLHPQVLQGKNRRIKIFPPPPRKTRVKRDEVSFDPSRPKAMQLRLGGGIGGRAEDLNEKSATSGSIDTVDQSESMFQDRRINRSNRQQRYRAVDAASQWPQEASNWQGLPPPVVLPEAVKGLWFCVKEIWT